LEAWDLNKGGTMVSPALGILVLLFAVCVVMDRFVRVGDLEKQ
jgi:hypothetical protein